MCGRYALNATAGDLIEHFGLVACPEWSARYNIAPQSSIPVIRLKPGAGRVGQMVRWGLVPSWAKDPGIGNKLNNARSETAADKPAFRSSFRRHRCLVPANGFYEWQALSVEGKIRKQPWYIHPTESGVLFAFAGLLAAWNSPAGDTIVSTCILTTGPNSLMAPIHDRMPVILSPDQFDLWLDPDNPDLDGLRGLMQPCDSDRMAAHPVSPAINRGTVEGPECIKPFEVVT